MRAHPQRLMELTWEDVAELLRTGPPVVVIPVGAVEQHGRHLPLGTDTYVAVDLAEAAAAQTGAVVAPEVACGMSPHHMVLPGTISVRPEVLLELVYDMVDSLYRHGFRGFVLLNGHRVVNVPWLQLAAERAQRLLPGCRVVVADPAYLSRELPDRAAFGPLGHADGLETAHLLHARPELVRLERAGDYLPAEAGLVHADPGVNLDTVCYTPPPADAARAVAEAAGGVRGRPTLSTAANGRRYREHVTRRLVEVIRALDTTRR